MLKTVGLGIQNFEKVIRANAFYIDKTKFISEWMTKHGWIEINAQTTFLGKIGPFRKMLRLN